MSKVKFGHLCLLWQVALPEFKMFWFKKFIVGTVYHVTEVKSKKRSLGSIACINKFHL